MRAAGRARVPELGERLPRLHLVADLHRDGARLEVRVRGVDVRLELEHDLVADRVGSWSSGLSDVRRCSGSPSCTRRRLRRRRRPRRRRRRSAARSVCRRRRRSVLLDARTVDGEGLGRLDAAAVDREAEITVDVRRAAPLETSHPSPATGARARSALGARSRPRDPALRSRRSITRARRGSGSVYSIRCVTRFGTVPGFRARSTSTATAADGLRTGVGVLVRSAWVPAASVAPSIRASSLPAGSRTVTLVNVTGSLNTLTTMSSYSTWYIPSSPRTTWASWIGWTRRALVRSVFAASDSAPPAGAPLTTRPTESVERASDQQRDPGVCGRPSRRHHVLLRVGRVGVRTGQRGLPARTASTTWRMDRITSGPLSIMML